MEIPLRDREAFFRRDDIVTRGERKQQEERQGLHSRLKVRERMTKPMYYTLDENGDAVGTDDVHQMSSLFEHPERRRVGWDDINGITVSTVFLAMDHNWSGDGPPVLWETMIFGGTGEIEDYQERYTSRAAAVEGHARAVAIVQRLLA